MYQTAGIPDRQEGLVGDGFGMDSGSWGMGLLCFALSLPLPSDCYAWGTQSLY